MNIKYNSDVEKYFSNFRLMQKEIGDIITRAVKKRIDELKASKNVGVFLSTGLDKPHLLEANMRGYIAVNLTANYRLIFKPSSDDLSPMALNVCTEIIVKGVEDYHDGKNEWLIP